jgi:hypothetical protein
VKRALSITNSHRVLPRRRVRLCLPLFLIILAAALSACNLLPGGQAAPTQTTAATAAPRGTVVSKDTAVPTATTAPAATTAPVSQTVKIFLIAIGDNGQSGKLIGCGDSVVAVERQIAPTSDVLRAAFQELFSIKQRDYGESGLIDALYQADLQIESVSLTNGVAEVKLTGTLTLSGECDNPRAEAQLTETALQFATVTQVNILLNGVALHDALSLK